MLNSLLNRVCKNRIRLVWIFAAILLLQLTFLALFHQPTAVHATQPPDPTYRWHTFYGSYLDDWATDMARDSNGNLYLTGESDGPFTGPNGELPLHGYGGTTDIVVVKLDANGNYLWHTYYGWVGTEKGYRIALDPNGNIYVAGDSEDSWLGPNSAAPLHKYSAYEDLFVLKLDPNGNYLWHTFYGSNGSDLSGGLAADSSGVYISGAGSNAPG